MRFDVSGDGLLELKEISEGLKQVFGHVKGSMKIFEDIVKSLDKNANGLIDYTEFITAAADKTKMLSEKNLKFAFNMMDKDHNGSITKQELKGMFETSEEKDETLWQSIFDEVDINKDGSITYEEFAAHMHLVVERHAKTNYITADGKIDEALLLKDLEQQG